MSAQPATERRTRPRQSASLPTMGLSLEEIVLLLEIAPKGWSEEEAIGLVRRIARDVCSQSKNESSAESRRWKTLAAGTDADVLAELDRLSTVRLDSAGDTMVARAARLLKQDLAAIHR